MGILTTMLSESKSRAAPWRIFFVPGFGNGVGGGQIGCYLEKHFKDFSVVTVDLEMSGFNPFQRNSLPRHGFDFSSLLQQATRDFEDKLLKYLKPHDGNCNILSVGHAFGATVFF